MDPYRRAALIPEVRTGIDRLPLHLDLVMQVRARRSASITGEGDDLAALHLLLGLDAETSQMPVQGLDVVPVVDDEGDPVLRVLARIDHDAGRGRHHRRSPRHADIEPAVLLDGLALPRGAAAAKLGGHGPAPPPART